MMPSCRRCKGPVDPPRRSWCSQDCVDAFLFERHQSVRRARVKERDQGVCAECGLDTVAFCRALRRLERGFVPPGRSYGRTRGLIRGRQWIRAREIRRALRIPSHRFADLWDADHIMPQVEGGPQTMENLRTLCIWCHRRATAELHARLARRRREGKRGVAPQLSLAV
ncbi:HNH endonuclease [Candidatus Binatia bacterium]|nr:HNH endonuclease [Candidatus Binatia bacterium]